MEAGVTRSTAGPELPPVEHTIADIAARAAANFGTATAIRRKVSDGEWREVSYDEVEVIVREIALGLIDLGVEPGERVCILADTSPEWTYACFAVSAAGAVVVPIYPTNSPKECEWVAGNSGAVVAICENATQIAKLEQVLRATARPAPRDRLRRRRDHPGGAARARPCRRRGRAGPARRRPPGSMTPA